jgi:hypothetical protein
MALLESGIDNFGGNAKRVFFPCCWLMAFWHALASSKEVGSM